MISAERIAVKFQRRETKTCEIQGMKITDLTNPLQTMLLTSRADGKDNIMALDWHMPASFEPMMYAVSIGKTRHTLGIVRKSGVFVVNFMITGSEKDILYCGRHTGVEADKFAQTGLKKVEAETIDCPRLEIAAGYLECVVEKEIEAGDHIVFIARVAKAALQKNGKRPFHVAGDKFVSTND
jgi:flavin reductase (DIM6/NTAB) family NADH-FMN oxidoreductase RutF